MVLTDRRDHRLLDVVEGRDARPLCDWLAARPKSWRDQISTVTIDMSESYLSVAHTMLPDATVVADPFHVVKNANERLDECRRRVQQQVLERRGHRDDPLYRSRRVLVMANERLSDDARKRRTRLLDQGDPRGEVRDAGLAKEAVRELYRVDDPDEAADWVAALALDMQDRSYPPEVRKLGRMLASWGERIVAWHRTRASNAATEAINNLAKRVKRVAFGIVNWDHWRTRVLLYAGGCDWSKLATLTPLPPRSRTASAP